MEGMLRLPCLGPLALGLFLVCLLLFRAVLSIRLAFELRDDGSVYRAIKHCHGQVGVTEVFGPVLEVNVGHQCGGFSPTAMVNDLVEETGSFRVFAQFQFFESEFVNDQ